MEGKAKERSLRVLVRRIAESGEPFEVELTESELDSILRTAEGGYRTMAAGAVARLVLSRSEENVFVRGSVVAPVGYTCSRCMAEKTERLSIEVNWTFLPVERFRPAAEEGEIELTLEDLDVSFYDGDTVDLGEIVREAVLLELNPFPVCQTECETVASEQPGREVAGVDPRWLPLLELRRRRRS